MARGTGIIVSSEPRGIFMEGTITDTSKPGQLVEIVPNQTFVGGEPNFRARSQSNGAAGPIFVLLNDDEQGKLSTDAYVANTRCRVYVPLAGEDVNVLLGDATGTGDIVTQGDLFGVSSLGKIIANAGFTSTPFQSMETLPGLSADTLVWCKRL